MAGTPLILQPLVKYVDFNGRARRAEFWPFYLLVMVVFWVVEGWLLLPFLPLLKGGQVDIAAVLKSIIPPYVAICGLGLLLLLPLLGLQVRRLHDSNRTGWWVILPMGASYVGQTLVYIFQGDAIMRATQAMQAQMQTEMMNGGFDFSKILELEWPVMGITLPYTMGASLVATLILWFFFAMPGTNGPNRFGTDPKAQ